MKTRLTLVVFIILGLFLTALVSRSSALALMTLPFLFYLGAGLLTAPGPASLRAVRVLTQTRSQPDAAITMKITIHNDGKSIPRLHIREQAWPKMEITEGDLESWAALPAGETAGLAYTFQAPRGEYRWDTIQVTASDPFGLFETRLDLPAPAQLRVVPDQVSQYRLPLRLSRTLRIPGPNLSRLPGSGTDFYGVREYHPGDSMRWIHWRRSARHPGSFFSKDFEREEMADVGLLVDASAPSGFRPEMDSLYEYSIQAAAVLAKSFLHAGNRVSLLTLGERVARVFPGSGKRQLVRILDELAGCSPGGKVSLDMLKYLPVRLFPSHSLIVVISPLRQRDFSAIARLRADGYQVLLVSPDPVRFASRTKIGRLASLAVRSARLERAALLWRIRELGVQVIDCQVDQPFLTSAGALRWARR